MKVFVLDASAVLRYIDGEPGGLRVKTIFRSCDAGEAETCMSAVQWGEVAGKLLKRTDEKTQRRLLESLRQLGLSVVSATAERAEHAASLRVDHKISYADAFALDLAMGSPDHVLVTADYGFKPVEELARIEFLPAK